MWSKSLKVKCLKELVTQTLPLKSKRLSAISSKTVLNKLRNNFIFCAKYQISCNYLQINAKKNYRKLNLDKLSREVSLNLTIYFKNLQDLTWISTFIDKIIQTNLTFANTIWKHMFIRNLDYLFQNISQRVKYYKSTTKIFQTEQSFY